MILGIGRYLFELDATPLSSPPLPWKATPFLKEQVSTISSPPPLDRVTGITSYLFIDISFICGFPKTSGILPSVKSHKEQGVLSVVTVVLASTIALGITISLLGTHFRSPTGLSGNIFGVVFGDETCVLFSIQKY